MRLLCPECHQPLDPTLLVCPNAHQFSVRDGVLVLLAEIFAAELQVFSATLRQMRTDTSKRLSAPAIYDQLPCALSMQQYKEWRTRCRDLQLVKRLITNHFGPRGTVSLKILDVGAYNGWLSHNLARLGHEVTGIEYFRDPFDGLGARQFHTAVWYPIQMDLLDLSLLDQMYEVVIMNHGLCFFPNPVSYVEQLLKKVAPGGLFVAIGLQFWRNPRKRQEQIAARQRAYLQRYGRQMLLRPAPGYLDSQDKARMAHLGLTFHSYPHTRVHNLFAHAVIAWAWRGYALARPSQNVGNESQQGQDT
jgi:2-polyprenyl-3-methyl-5-hydroxy-6-metoxy-1,4-benzoquinol methylase